MSSSWNTERLQSHIWRSRHCDLSGTSTHRLPSCSLPYQLYVDSASLLVGPPSPIRKDDTAMKFTAALLLVAGIQSTLADITLPPPVGTISTPATPAAPSPPNPATAPQVNLGYGVFQGKVASGINNFLGIPFARPPVGDLRFRRAVLPLNYTGIQGEWASGDFIEIDRTDSLAAFRCHQVRSLLHSAVSRQWYAFRCREREYCSSR